MSPNSAGLTDEDLPSLYQAADQTSLSGQRRYLRALKGLLGGSVVAAMGGALATGAGAISAAAYAAAIAFIATLGITLYMAVLRPERAWYDGRAAAESAKSLAWEYAVGGGPFCIRACHDPDALLLERLRDLVTKLRNFAVTMEDASGEQITQMMRSLRSEPLDRRRSAYIRDRLEDQRSWYARKAAWNGKRYHGWLVAAIAAQVLGVVAGFLLAVGTVEVDGLGVLAAIASSIAAWVQAKDHAGLAQAYGIAAQELGLARTRLEGQAGSDEEAFASLVDDAEQAISREHTLWLARRGSVSLAG